MSTRNLAYRLKRLETRLGPSPEIPRHFVIDFINPMTKEVSFKLVIGPGYREYRSADNQPISAEEVARLSSPQRGAV